jgi:hypothetical protein
VLQEPFSRPRRLSLEPRVRVSTRDRTRSPCQHTLRDLRQFPAQINGTVPPPSLTSPRRELASSSIYKGSALQAVGRDHLRRSRRRACFLKRRRSGRAFAIGDALVTRGRIPWRWSWTPLTAVFCEPWTNGATFRPGLLYELSSSVAVVRWRACICVWLFGSIWNHCRPRRTCPRIETTAA